MKNGWVAETVDVDGRLYMDAITVGKFMKYMEKEFSVPISPETKKFFKYARAYAKGEVRDEEFDD